MNNMIICVNIDIGIHTYIHIHLYHLSARRETVNGIVEREPVSNPEGY